MVFQERDSGGQFQSYSTMAGKNRGAILRSFKKVELTKRSHWLDGGQEIKEQRRKSYVTYSGMGSEVNGVPITKAGNPGGRWNEKRATEFKCWV